MKPSPKTRSSPHETYRTTSTDKTARSHQARTAETVCYPVHPLRIYDAAKRPQLPTLPRSAMRRLR